MKKAVPFAVVIFALYVVLHISIALISVGFDFNLLEQKLSYLDSFWYTHLATEGYSPTRGLAFDVPFAFYPLYPLILRMMLLVVPISMHLFFASFFSLTLFAIVFFHAARQRVALLGLFFLAFSPASWVFFSNHTESLFLFLTYFAFCSATKNRIVFASVLAGLAALTRNQGVLCAAAIALLLCLQTPGLSLRSRIRIFLCSGFISASLYALWLSFLYWKTGDVLASVKAQDHWGHIELREYFSKLVWLSVSNFWRACLLWMSVAICFVKIRQNWRKNLAIYAYVLGSVLLWPLQGSNFPSALRFAAVLFPMWFALGEYGHVWFAKFQTLQARVGFGVLVLLTVAISASISVRYFFQGAWPY